MPGVIAAAVLPVIAGCSQSGGPVTGGGTPTPVVNATLPIQASGKALAFTANSTNTASVNPYTNLPDSQHELTQAQMLERSPQGGIRINGSADKDTNPNTNQGVNPALISANSPDALDNGTTLAGMTDAKGSVYFENGNFGDPQVSNASANLSAVGVYNVYQNNTFVEQIVMRHGTTIRYQEGADGAATATYAVGYIGDNTTNMPGSGTATYKGFHEGGTTGYDDNGTIRQMGLSGGTVELTANFGAGTVTGGVRGAELVTYQGNQRVVLNNAIAGLDINANITGSEYTGTANLVDANNNPVGATTTNQAIGAFFGDAAAETAAAYMIEGNAVLDGQARDYIMSGTLGAVKK
ncbi:hypothetical protein AWJ14_09760 [Hoeflea olei]|uniref:Transferrin-binding protein B C-lobe/N-lobe beta-barrel domain-containing protein n=2 Tax=Hoeflea olei TaxID=1480615 RepID=A0A1C1Z0U7_9HYPH|nr:hypothetical protein AWJ14_09760 [Hoeflea olei]